jgi:hypothetical protein
MREIPIPERMILPCSSASRNRTLPVSMKRLAASAYPMENGRVAYRGVPATPTPRKGASEGEGAGLADR